MWSSSFGGKDFRHAFAPKHARLRPRSAERIRRTTTKFARRPTLPPDLRGPRKSHAVSTKLHRRLARDATALRRAARASKAHWRSQTAQALAPTRRAGGALVREARGRASLAARFAPAQDELGRYVDLAVASRLAREVAEAGDGRAWFSVGLAAGEGRPARSGSAAWRCAKSPKHARVGSGDGSGGGSAQSHEAEPVDRRFVPALPALLVDDPQQALAFHGLQVARDAVVDIRVLPK